MKQYSKKQSTTENLHFSMFVPNAQIAKDNASHAFGKQLGAPLGNTPITTIGGVRVPDLVGNIAPGILSLGTALTIGSTAEGFSAPINKACRALYAKYWAKNSSISKFQEMDIGIYTIASAQIVGLYSWLCAIYAATFMNDVTNKYTRSGVLAGLGVSPADITKHTTDLRGWINQLTIDLAGFNLDKSIPLYQYAAKMYTSFLKDEANYSKTQYYVSVPRFAWKYVKSGDNIGSLTPEPMVEWDAASIKLLTYDELITKVKTVVDAFIGSYYVADISTAIGKAVENNVYVLPMIDENYRCEFKFDEIALTRIKNAVVTPATVSNITQDVVDRKLICTVTKSVNVSADNGLATVVGLSEPPMVHAISPATATPENVLALTSLTTDWETPKDVVYGDSTPVQCTMKHFGYEVALAGAIVTYTDESTLGVMAISSCVGFGANPGGAISPNWENVMKAAWVAREFDYFPNLRLYCFIPDDEVYKRINVMDTDYSDAFSSSDLEKVHRASVQTIFGVPETL